MLPFADLSLGILAGGRSSRLGGADKAMLEYRGQSLLARALDAFPGPFAERMLSYNRGSLVFGSAMELRVVPDLRPGQPGPLAALEALWMACRTRWLLTAPVDVRDWPRSLQADLLDAVGSSGIGCVLADADGLQPLVGVWDVAVVRASAGAAIDAGRFAVHRWLESQAIARLDISPRRLGNLNSPADFATG